MVDNAAMDLDPPLLDVKFLRLLDLLCATGSVTRSADALGQSQSTISTWLSQLRQQLDDPLFIRTSKGMLPTPRTEALIGTVREILAGMSRLSRPEKPFDPATAEKRFSICMTDASHITLLPSILNHVHAVAPGISLQASVIGPDLADKLESGEADIALGYLPWLDAGFYQQTFYKQDWICLANAHHPRIGDKLAQCWSLEAYQAERHISISSGTGHQLLDNAIESLQIRRKVGLELPGFLGLSSILGGSNLIATLPRMIGETLARAGHLRVLPCPFEIPGFTVKQYWHARYQQDSANRWLRSVCAGLFMHQA